MFPSEILVLLLAMAPISEVRGAIPLGIYTFSLPFWKVFLIALLGSTLSIVIILLLLDSVSKFLSEKSKFFKKFFEWLFEKTRKKLNKRIEKYEEWGIFLVSAVPLPLFGVWTGALGAFLFDIPFKVAFPLLFFGNLIAIGLVSGVTLSGIAIEKVFGWQTLIGILLFILIVFLIYKLVKKKK